MPGSGFLVDTFFFLYLTLTNEGGQNTKPISFFFSKGRGHKFIEFACFFFFFCYTVGIVVLIIILVVSFY